MGESSSPDKSFPQAFELVREACIQHSIADPHYQSATNGSIGRYPQTHGLSRPLFEFFLKHRLLLCCQFHCGRHIHIRDPHLDIMKDGELFNDLSEVGFALFRHKQVQERERVIADGPREELLQDTLLAGD